jgi:uncharacterized membrane protein
MDLTIVTNIIAFFVFMICVLSYGIKLQLGIKKPTTTKRGLLNIYYYLWVRQMSYDTNKLEAIQTMRNLIMSVTFLSSTMLILLGVLLQTTSNGFDDILHSFPSISSSILPQYKILVLFIVVVFSLIMFLLSLRHMVRFSILIGIPTGVLEKTSKQEVGDKENNINELDAQSIQSDVFLKAMNRFMYGIRGVYYVTALLLWFISSYVFMIGTILITFFLIKYHDIKTPNLEKTPI